MKPNQLEQGLKVLSSQNRQRNVFLIAARNAMLNDPIAFIDTTNKLKIDLAPVTYTCLGALRRLKAPEISAAEADLAAILSKQEPIQPSTLSKMEIAALVNFGIDAANPNPTICTKGDHPKHNHTGKIYIEVTEVLADAKRRAQKEAAAVTATAAAATVTATAAAATAMKAALLPTATATAATADRKTLAEPLTAAASPPFSATGTPPFAAASAGSSPPPGVDIKIASEKTSISSETALPGAHTTASSKGAATASVSRKKTAAGADSDGEEDTLDLIEDLTQALKQAKATLEEQRQIIAEQDAAIARLQVEHWENLIAFREHTDNLKNQVTTSEDNNRRSQSVIKQLSKSMSGIQNAYNEAEARAATHLANYLVANSQLK